MVRKGKEKVAEKQASAAGEGKLYVTEQQSRYRADAVDAPTSKEILIKDLGISIGQREILRGADIHLDEGKHYVLVGKNGIGKSVLLQAIGKGHIPSIAPNVRILLLSQTQSEEAEEQAEPDQPSNDAAGDLDRLTISDNAAPPHSEQRRSRDETVLEHVLRANEQLTRLQKEASLLNAGLSNSTDPLAPVRAYRLLKHRRLARELEIQRQVATRRSGARGKNARWRLIEMEDEFEASRTRLSVPPSDLETVPGNAGQLAQETRAAADALGDVQAELDALDAAAFPAHARAVLLGLGFSAPSLDEPVANLSGGWRTRCALACALCQPEADVLLLDEPTNFLDLPSIVWLQNHIADQLPGTTVVAVSHDRAFVDAVADELLVMRDCKIERFRGNLSTYERERRKNAKWMQRMKDTQERQRDRLTASLDNSAKVARKAGDDKKLKQVAGRKKKMEERAGLQVSAKGTRFKLHRDLVGYSTTWRAEIEVPKFDPLPTIVLPTTPADLKFPGALVSLEKVWFRYPDTKDYVLKDVDITIHPGERVGIAGLNGSGKTTLLELMTGDAGVGDVPSSGAGSSVLLPTKGSITRHSRVRIGRFSQQAVEHLDALPEASTTSALAHLLFLFRNPTGDIPISEQEARGLLSGLGLQGRIVSDVPIASLSGGQKVRLALAKLLWPAPPQLLVLDEVTTHLDADTILALVKALRSFEGALLVVSHDRFFVRGVVEGEKLERGAGFEDGDEEECDSDASSENGEGENRTGVVYRLTKGKLTKLEGGMAKYEAIAERASAKLGAA